METYRDAGAAVEARVADLLARMTLPEKIGQMMQLPAKTGLSAQNFADKLEAWHIGSYLHCSGEMMEALQARAERTRLGIPLLFGIDAIHGHCFDNRATVFPTQLALSSAWDPDLARRMARVAAAEVRASGQHWTFSPVLCVARDPRWGRVDETSGEDAWLGGVLAAAMVEGYQGERLDAPDSILACPKHFAAYGESSGGRDSYEAGVSRRRMLETFLPPFERAVRRAGAGSLMAGYQAIDGVPASANRWLLTEVAKEAWGLDGFIVTDWNNVGSLASNQAVAADLEEAALKAILAGNDMMMFTPDFYAAALRLVESGRAPLAAVDAAVARVLRAKFRLGLFDGRSRPEPGAAAVLGSPAHWAVALEASRKSLVLLKNDGVLPIDAGRIKKILLAGPNADDVFAQLGDWSFGSIQAAAVDDGLHRDVTVSPLAGLRAACAERGVGLDYVKGADCLDPEYDEIAVAAAAAAAVDLVVVCVGDTLAQHGEGHDRSDLGLSGKQPELLEALKASGKPLVVVFLASKPLAIPWIKDKADAVLCAFNPGAKGGQAIAEVLFGDVNPSGKLTVSFPHSAGQLPVHYDQYPGWHGGKYVDCPAEPVFAFGEGMGYSRFEYSGLRMLTPSVAPGHTVRCAVTVRNRGGRAGDEIVQAYFRDLAASVTLPAKRLAGFKRVSLGAGQAAEVELAIEYDDLALVTPDLVRVVEPGEFELMVGPSSRDGDLLRARFRAV
jgi:beta-glucosidase